MLGEGLAKGVPVWRNGNQPNSCEREMTEPAPTIHFGHNLNCVEWVVRTNNDSRQAGGSSKRFERDIESPSPSVTTSVKSWVRDRPATTVNGDPRISEPGHHDENESGSQQKNAVRVTVEEAATLQSFPPDLPWQGVKTAKFRQIGNAVPPLLARAILTALLASRGTVGADTQHTTSEGGNGEAHGPLRGRSAA